MRIPISAFENRNVFTSSHLQACDTCGGMTAWSRCVTCGGVFDYHCPQGKYYKKGNN